jgi:protocatechuate 3,4-dioxygenase beta subunit
MGEHAGGAGARPRTKLSRRDMLGFAVKGAAVVVVTQAIPGRAEDLKGLDGGSDVEPGSDATSCVLTAALTEGPYFIDERLERSDIRSDPETGILSPGVPLALSFNVMRVSRTSCTPLTGAYLDVWHCDAGGAYSGVGQDRGEKFLRGYQITDADGAARFTTVYPGWYRGRAVHVHFKLRLFAGATRTYEFTSQFFFDEALTDQVHARSPYSARGHRNVVNSRDGIYNSLSTAEKAALTLNAVAGGDGYTGVITLGVQVG